MNEEMISLEALVLARGYVYELFHKLTGGTPTPGLLDALASPEAADSLEEFMAGDETLAKMRSFMDLAGEKLGSPESRPAFCEAAKDEYVRLYVGPAQLPALPTEGAYVGHEAVLFSPSTLKVRAAFAESGYEAARLGHVPDDHVSLMCDFMARMSERSLDALRSSRWEEFSDLLLKQGAFCAGHMLNWLPDFARLQARVKDPVLYPQVSAAISQLAKVDVVFLERACSWVRENTQQADVRPEFSDAVRPTSFDALENAWAALRALRLQGLEECELRII